MIKHVYIHIPFCLSKCLYCSFHSVSDASDKYIEDYFIRLYEEIDYYHTLYNIVPETIYIGGGTPNSVNSNYIRDLMNKFNKSSICELTIEMNPYFDADIKEYNKMGINRISIGMQSMINRELRLLGRVNTVQESEKFILGIPPPFPPLQRGAISVSFDLIYGLPNQKLKDIKLSLERMIKYNPKHLSIYCLSLDKDVLLNRLYDKLPSEETTSEMYYIISEYLLQNGFNQYELSNFAMEGYESKHNLAYWSGVEYLGFGASASGFVNKTRYVNNDLSEYINESFIKEKINLSNEDIIKEYIITGLRKTQGIHIQEFNKRFQTDFLEKYPSQIKKLLKNDLIIVNDYVRIAPEYYFISNEVLCEFV